MRPAAMDDGSIAGGAEAMVRLRSGEFIVFSETARPKGMLEARVVLRFSGDPTEASRPVARFAYVPPAGYDPTDVARIARRPAAGAQPPAVALPGLFTARLSLIDIRGVRRRRTVLRGTEIARFDASPLLHDNFEALAITREDGADTILWIASGRQYSMVGAVAAPQVPPGICESARRDKARPREAGRAYAAYITDQ